jgi:hypothetical protein
MNEAAQTGLNGTDAFTGQLQTGTVVPGLDVGSLLGNMSMTVIIVSIVAGLIGSGYFMYGKRTMNIPMIISGVLLCIVPYFISNTLILIIACLIMLAAPFVVERYA